MSRLPLPRFARCIGIRSKGYKTAKDCTQRKHNQNFNHKRRPGCAIDMQTGMQPVMSLIALRLSPPRTAPSPHACRRLRPAPFQANMQGIPYRYWTLGLLAHGRSERSSERPQSGHSGDLSALCDPVVGLARRHGRFIQPLILYNHSTRQKRRLARTRRDIRVTCPQLAQFYGSFAPVRRRMAAIAATAPGFRQVAERRPASRERAQPEQPTTSGRVVVTARRRDRFASKCPRTWPQGRRAGSVARSGMTGV